MTNPSPEFSQADFMRAIKLLSKAKTRRARTEFIEFGQPVGREVW